jgi:hypothetical protein
MLYVIHNKRLMSDNEPYVQAFADRGVMFSLHSTVLESNDDIQQHSLLAIRRAFSLCLDSDGLLHTPRPMVSPTGSIHGGELFPGTKEQHSRFASSLQRKTNWLPQNIQLGSGIEAEMMGWDLRLGFTQ